jgi:NDP-sugar pyrophosphorylase family protein
MKAVLLAAGAGERLGELSKELPKPMIRMDGKPILEHNVEMCRTHGVRELFINLHHLPEAITSYFGDGARWGVSISYAYEPVLLGTAGAVKNFATHLAGEPFFVVYGDNRSRCDLSALWRSHGERAADMSIAVFATESVGAGGVVEMEDDGRIRGFVEQRVRQDGGPGLVNAGIYVLESKMVDLVGAGFSDFGHDVIPALIRNGRRVFGVLIDHEVRAVDTPALYEKWADRK